MTDFAQSRQKVMIRWPLVLSLERAERIGTTGADAMTTQTEAETTFSLLEAYCLAYVAAEAKGWPKHDIRQGIAEKVVWLERRGMPGLMALVSDFLNHAEKPGERGPACPLIASAILSDQLPEYLSESASEMRIMRGPSHGVLVLPTVAHHSEKIGAPIRVSWLIGEPRDVVAQSVVCPDGTVLTRGDRGALISNDAVGFALASDLASDLTSGKSGETRPDVSVTGDINEASLPAGLAMKLATFVGDRRLNDSIRVAAIVTGDDAIGRRALEALSAGDRSTNMAAALCDDESLLITTKNSANEQFRQHLTRLGWMQRVAQGRVNLEPVIAEMSAVHELTVNGRCAVAMLFGGEALFEVDAPSGQALAGPCLNRDRSTD